MTFLAIHLFTKFLAVRSRIRHTAIIVILITIQFLTFWEKQRSEIFAKHSQHIDNKGERIHVLNNKIATNKATEKPQ